MPITIAIMLTAIMVLAFHWFQMCKKQCRSLSRKHKFQKKAPKCSHSAGQNLMSKIQGFSYRIRKFNKSHFFSIAVHKIHKSKSNKSQR